MERLSSGNTQSWTVIKISIETTFLKVQINLKYHISTNLYKPQEKDVQGLISKLPPMALPVPQSCILKSGWVLFRPLRAASYKLPHKRISFQVSKMQACAQHCAPMSQ